MMNNMEIKQGDKVRVSDATPWIYTRNQYKGYDCKVEAVAGDGAIVSQLNVKFPIPTKYLVKVDAEAKEAKFKYKVGQKVILHFYGGEVSTITEAFRDGGVWNKYKVKALPHHIWNENELDPYTEPTEQTEAEKPNHTITIPVEVDLTDSYWDAYAADLAKEVALKVANKYSDPEQAAEYAVQVAKAVVEGLKRK